MPVAIYITASAGISKARVFKNEKSVFENKTADLPDFLLAIYHHFGLKYPKFHKMDYLSKAGWLASEVLLKDSYEAGKYKPEEVGVVLTNASSSLDTDLKYFESTKDIASPALFVYTLPNIVIGEICIRNGLKGESAFFIFETFDPDFIENYVSNLINNNILQACICGWVELIGEEWLIVLFLVEKNLNKADHPLAAIGTESMVFKKENLNKIYHLING
ncbi:MAG: hypothetical protein ABI760_03835 [Ferruginibacter sp.]